MTTQIKKPIFVVGCCNSGTTILWKTLLTHKDLDGPRTEGQDLQDLPQIMKHFLGKRTFRMFAHPKFKGSYRLREKDYDKRLADRIAAIYAEHCEPGKRLIEKSPANSVRTRFLQSIFPDAYFIIMVRNGMAVSEGIVRKRLFDPDRPHMAGLHTAIDEAAEQWLYTNRILLEDRLHLRKSIIIKYEDLVNNTKEVLYTVLRFVECDNSDFATPVFETDHNGKQTARLSSGQKRIIQAIAGEMLNYFGYYNAIPLKSKY